jgi:hypothetical protein
MAKGLIRRSHLTPIQQRIRLRELFGELIESIDVQRSVLSCVVAITPSDQSDTYKVRIVQKEGNHPKIWLLFPNLQTREGRKPPHLYSNSDKDGNPCLCVYYPREGEWNNTMFIAETIVPWISTWLNAYEFWVITGKWYYPESPHGLNGKKKAPSVKEPLI